MKKSTVVRIVAGVVGVSVGAGLAYLNARSNRKFVEQFDISESLKEAMANVDKMVAEYKPVVKNPTEGKVEEVEGDNPFDGIDKWDATNIKYAWKNGWNVYVNGKGTSYTGAPIVVDTEDAVSILSPKHYDSLKDFTDAVVSEVARLKPNLRIVK